MDTLLSLDDETYPSSNIARDKDNNNNNNDSNKNNRTSKADTNSRVNFTKASCTLDASVKIYSFRVDDVHLTSYKVLANLNRTQHNKVDDTTKKTGGNNSETMTGDDDVTNDNSQHPQSKSFNGNTLETNMGKLISLS